MGHIEAKAFLVSKGALDAFNSVLARKFKAAFFLDENSVAHMQDGVSYFDAIEALEDMKQTIFNWNFYPFFKKELSETLEWAHKYQSHIMDEAGFPADETAVA